jgi:hypothetical protein
MSKSKKQDPAFIVDQAPNDRPVSQGMSMHSSRYSEDMRSEGGSTHHFSLVSLLAESENEYDEPNLATEDDAVSNNRQAAVEDERAQGPKKDSLTRLQVSTS